MSKKKMVLITGAARGIGLATVRLFLQQGFRVVATDCAYDAEMETKSEDFLHYFKMDVANCEAVEVVISKIEKELGSIDILIHVAGIFQSCPVAETTSTQWQKIYQVNTEGVFYVTQFVSQAMKARRTGSMVVVSSNAAKFPRQNMAAYASSKAAASMYVKCLALELAAYGIRCNLVAPGSTDTLMQRQLWEGSSTVPQSILAGDLERFRPGIPLKKIATPEEVAEAIFFLASAKASHITMAELTIDGGATMGV